MENAAFKNSCPKWREDIKEICIRAKSINAQRKQFKSWDSYVTSSFYFIRFLL